MRLFFSLIYGRFYRSYRGGAPASCVGGGNLSCSSRRAFAAVATQESTAGERGEAVLTMPASHGRQLWTPLAYYRDIVVGIICAEEGSRAAVLWVLIFLRLT